MSFAGGAAPTPSDSDNDMNDDLSPPSSPDPSDLPSEEDDLPPYQSEPHAGRQKAVAAVMEQLLPAMFAASMQCLPGNSRKLQNSGWE